MSWFSVLKTVPLTDKEEDYPKEIKLKEDIFERDGIGNVDSDDATIFSMIYTRKLGYGGPDDNVRLDKIELTLKDAESLAFDVNNMSFSGTGLSDIEQNAIVSRQESENLQQSIQQISRGEGNFRATRNLK